ncbi:MAG: DUF2934 domain-containing protein [Phycisphaerae bacterium]
MATRLGVKRRDIAAPSRTEQSIGESREYEPTHEQIRERAYAIYLSRGGAASDPGADWAQAEHELRAELATLIAR